MSKHKRLHQVPACGGEAFEDSFYFTSMLDSHGFLDESLKNDKSYGDYVNLSFLKKNMIKTKFSITGPSSNITPLASTRGDTSPRRFTRWGWSNTDFDKEDSTAPTVPPTPIAKKAKKILQMVDKPKNIGIEPLEDGDEDIYSTSVATNVYSL